MTNPGGRTLGSGTASYFDVTITTTEDTTLRSLLEAHGNWDESRGVLAVDFVTIGSDFRLYETSSGATDNEFETISASDAPVEGQDIGVLDQRVSVTSGTSNIVVKVHWQRPSMTVTNS